MEGREKTELPYPGDVVDDAVDNLALERLEDDSAIARDELGLAVARDDHALADVGYGDDGDDEAELARAGALYVRVELRLEVLLHARPKVGRVQHDRVRELFLCGQMLIGVQSSSLSRTMKNIARWVGGSASPSSRGEVECRHRVLGYN